MVEQALLCRPALLPDESLWSYFIRLAAANAYEPLSLLTGLCVRRLAALGLRDNLVHPRHPETFSILASLTQLSSRTLANASLHPFADAPLLSRSQDAIIYLEDGAPLSLLSTFWRTRYLLPPEHAQFCPECLQEAVYHRRAWALSDISACLEHQRVLLDRCTHCDALVSVQDIVRCQCGRCGANLTRMDQKHGVTAFGMFAQSIARSWWGLDSPVITSAEWTLLAQPFSIVYRLFMFLAQRFAPGMSHNNGVYLAPHERYQAQLHALQALTNWPVEFRKFLDAALKQDVRTQSICYGEDFGLPVYLKNGLELDTWVQCFWETEGFGFLRAALLDFFEENNIQLCFEHGRLHLKIHCGEDLQRMARPLAQPQQRYMAKAVEKL